MEYLATMFALVMTFVSSLLGIPGEIPVESASQFATTTAQVIAVTDGDTIRVSLDGREEVVRYIGIDTPEQYRDGEPACYAVEATTYNESLVAGQIVTLVSDVSNRDQYDRLLRYVYADDVSINNVLLAGGYARTMSIAPNTSQAEQLAATEQTARDAGVGLWSACAEAEVAAAPAVTDENQNSTQAAAAEPITIDTTILSPGQQRLLSVLGIDTSVVVVTAEMMTCAETAVGTDRLAEITSGTLPTLTEGWRLAQCYQ